MLTIYRNIAEPWTQLIQFYVPYSAFLEYTMYTYAARQNIGISLKLHDIVEFWLDIERGYICYFP